MFLFLPSNPAHYRTMEPVARELDSLGSDVGFIVRDGCVGPAYQIEPLVEAGGFRGFPYSGYYRVSLFHSLPPLGPWRRMRRDVFAFLDSVPFQALILGNDCTVLFERLAIEYCRVRDRVSLLIQESVRPAHRSLPLRVRANRDGPRAFLRPLESLMATRLAFRGYGRPDYGHSQCSLVAAAGEAFRNRLIAEGVSPSKIHVTGQPRLDRPRQDLLSARPVGPGPYTLLFCSQPSPVPQSAVDAMFIDLLRSCKATGDTRLLVKLHPRDLEPDHWFSLVSSDLCPFLLRITKNEPLESCVSSADAMITIASTTCLEAMQAAVPVGLVMYLPLEWYLPYEDYGAILPIRAPEDMIGVIQSLTRDSTVRERLIRSSEQVLHNELHLRDGHSARRIADLLLSSTREKRG